MTASENLVRRMTERFPRLQPLLEAHLDDMEGELLPYLYLADVARWAYGQSTQDDPVVKELTSWLEAEFEKAGADEKDLIGLGFVETIPSAPAGDPLLELLGTQLRQVADDLGLLG